MEGCLAPCCLDVDPAVYREQVNEAIMFLKGRTPNLIRKVKKQMADCARAQEFERAARLRDKIYSLERTIEKQIAVTTDFKDKDVFAVASSERMLGDHGTVCTRRFSYRNTPLRFFRDCIQRTGNDRRIHAPVL